MRHTDINRAAELAIGLVLLAAVVMYVGWF